MKIVLTAFAAAAAGLIAAGALGVAGATETTTTSSTTSTPTTTTTTTVTSAVSSPGAVLPPRTVAVEGIANEPIVANATAAAATAVYHQGMADAVADGQAKAQFLAGKVGASLGPAQSVTEGGGSIGCSGDLAYTGEQPDFGSGIAIGDVVPSPPVRVPFVASASPVHPNKATSKRRRGSAKKAAVVAGSCKLSTQLYLTYALN